MKFLSGKTVEILNTQQTVNSEQFAAVRKRLEQLGYTVCCDAETDRRLEMSGKEACVMATSDGKAIINFHTKTSASGMFEELIHLSQLKRVPIRSGADKSQEILACENEIAAKRKLLQNSKAYGITDYEIEIIKNSIRYYQKELRRLKHEFLGENY